ncbi:MAG: MEKHLA domain-containing protein [Nitrospiraceae bacterium]
MDEIPIWTRPSVAEWCRTLLSSYRHWTGSELIEPSADGARRVQALFFAPFVLVSHGIEHDPVLNYGNRMALDLWEMSWDELTATPSRLTAEPINRMERERILEEARTRGHIANYRGVRISKSGRRFMIEHAVVWNVVDSTGRRIGQAATFSEWTFL